MENRAKDVSIGFGDEHDTQSLAQALAAHVADFGPRDERTLTLVARDAQGAIAGGLNGGSHWHWLYIRHFWIAPAWRGFGLGRQLITAVETEARARHCVGLYLDTFDGDAEAFYHRCGFEQFGVMENFPPGHARRFLRKAL